MLLAGDIGGTKTVIALYEVEGSALRQLREETYPSQKHATLEEILDKFLSAGPRPTLTAGCWGVAGAVINGKCQTTNLPWQLDEKKLAQAIGAPVGKLLNDLESAAYGMLHLGDDEFCTLNAGGEKRPGNVAVIAAGTGLGEAILFWDGERYHPSASEGGHSTFAARNDLEYEFYKFLQKKHGEHVSYERVLSGPGFTSLWEFLRQTGRFQESPTLDAELKGTHEPNVVVATHGLAGDDPLCVKALELFAEIYGSESANLALKCLSVGGVYVGGGIAPKVLPALQNGAFLRGFLNKGRFATILKGMPVKVALNPKAPLIGAAHYAHRLS